MPVMYLCITCKLAKNIVGWTFTVSISKHSRRSLNKKIRSSNGMALFVCSLAFHFKQFSDMGDFLPKSLQTFYKKIKSIFFALRAK